MRIIDATDIVVGSLFLNGKFMFTTEQHVNNLVRHIELVRESCLLLGRRLIEEGKEKDGIDLIKNGFVHDASKFSGIEWLYLHAGRDAPKEMVQLAVQQHTSTNSHHPEFWGGVENMPEICVAEMVCDWYARAMEFGSSLRDWIAETAVSKYNIDVDGQQFEWINGFVDTLLQDNFVRW